MTVDEALKVLKGNKNSTNMLIGLLENRVKGVEREIENDRNSIKLLGKRIEENKVKVKQDKSILEAFKTVTDNQV